MSYETSSERPMTADDVREVRSGGEAPRREAPARANGDAAAQNPKPTPQETSQETSPTSQAPKAAADAVKPPPKPVAPDKIRKRDLLPALDDDADVGVSKEQTVTRDGKADLGFTGVLLASAAPATAPKGHWDEYRIYQTAGGKHVFSKVRRTVFAEEQDTYEADVFDPAPSSVSSQLLRSAREMARSRPLSWMDAAVAFFGYDPLAKALYRKLSVGFEEQIS